MIFVEFTRDDGLRTLIDVEQISEVSETKSGVFIYEGTTGNNYTTFAEKYDDVKKRIQDALITEKMISETTDEKTDAETLLNAAKKIKEYCASHDEKCTGCRFKKTEDEDCMFIGKLDIIPECWEV